MDLKAFIESGNLEAYLLGALSIEEAARVEADIAMYPELARELNSLEEVMFQFAAAESVSPAAGLEDKIWATLQPSGANVMPDAKIAIGSSPKGSARIIPLLPDSPVLRHTRFSKAAVWVALAGSVALNLLLWVQTGMQRRDALTLSNKMDTLQAEGKTLAQQLAYYSKGKDMMADTSMQTIVMHTVLKGHPMAATLYWSKVKGEAYVMMNALSVPPKGMQYQLWAIHDGKAMDMGVLPNDMANTAMIQKIGKPVNFGEAFAISLEKEGGSPAPTAANIYVLGKA